MHRTHAGHGSIWPSEAVESRASDQSTISPERIAELWALMQQDAWGDVPFSGYALLRKVRPALPALLDAAERLVKVGSAGDMFASTMPTTVDLAAANYARKTAERERDDALALASRAREDALREAIEICKEADAQDDRDNGAAATGAACNAANAILALIDKPKGGDRG